MRHHVVILGGSYAGIAAMRQLSKSSKLSITLIDQHPYHFLQTEGYELISSNTSFDESIVNLPSLCSNYDNVTFKHHTVTSINNQKKIVHLNDGQISYDTLVIALGSVTKRFECDPNVYNYSFGAKSLRGALKLHQFFQHELYRRLESAKQAKENFNIVIGGAGLSGVEIAAGMQHFFNRYYRSNTLSCATLNIHLIASRETILHGMQKQIIHIATKRLNKLRVNIHTQTRISHIHEHEITLTNDKVIPFDFMIFAGGTIAAPCLETLALPKNKKGQLLVDAYLRSQEDENIFVIGDCALLTNRKGKIQPPTAQTAEQSGAAAAVNILHLIENKPLKKAHIQIKGLAIALGGTYAAINIGKLYFSGYPAYLIKKLTEKIYKWPLWWSANQGFKKIEACEI